jgi:subtilase family serine protease
MNVSRSSIFGMAVALGMTVCGTANAGGGAAIAPALGQTVGTIAPQATKYFTVNLVPGTTSAQAQAVARYFSSFGLTASVTPQNDLIFVRGTYAQAASAAHTSFARVRAHNRVFTHAVVAESYPAAIAAHILATTIEEGPSAIAAGKTAGSPGGYSPSDIASYYDIAPLYNKGLSGKGQSIALLDCASVVPSDITTFETEYGLPANVPIVINVDGGTTATDLEPTGDVERVVATAPGVTVYLYVVPNDCSFGHLADGFAHIAADSMSKHFAAVSHSYGATEDDYAYYGANSQLQAEHTDIALLLKRAVPVFTVSGDWGATFGSSDQALYDGELTVWYPGSDPSAISTGGTEAVAVSATNPVRLEELAWGDGGGGVSADFGISAWQKTIPGLRSATLRHVPDVALASSAGEGYAAVWTPEGGSQGNYWFYGTSFAAPTWAGLIALGEQDRATAKKQPIANLAATLYAVRNVPGAFYDIVAGCNGYYCAQAGYDDVTGLGVFDGAKLEAALLALP